MLLLSRLVVSHGPSLGLCVAVHSSASPEHATGLLTSGTAPVDQAPDLKAVMCPDPSFCDVEALSPDGEAFLDLMRGV